MLCLLAIILQLVLIMRPSTNQNLYIWSHDYDYDNYVLDTRRDRDIIYTLYNYVQG